MAKIINTAYGTMGDVLPYLELGQGMKARGHDVYMAVPQEMHSHSLAAGLNPVIVGHEPVNPEKVTESALLWDHWLTDVDDIEARKKLPRSNTWFNLEKSISCLLNTCYDAELIVCNPQQELVAAIVAEKLSIPLVRVLVTPALLYQPNNWWKVTQRLRQNPEFHNPYHVLREKQKLKNSKPWMSYWKHEHLIFAASPYLYPSPPWCFTANQTGFWFYEDPRWCKWQPDTKLKEFMTTRPKPLVLSFSSQPIRNREEFIAVHISAAMKLNRRILIQGGWSGFNESHLPLNIDRDLVMFAGFMPQDWLFFHAAGVITHGGIGTVARALRNSCPMLLEPYTYEQCFNAHKVLSWGVGAAMFPTKLTAAGIARVLEEKVLTEHCQQRAQEIKLQIDAESGIEKACNIIEARLS